MKDCFSESSMAWFSLAALCRRRKAATGEVTYGKFPHTSAVSPERTHFLLVGEKRGRVKRKDNLDGGMVVECSPLFSMYVATHARPNAWLVPHWVLAGCMSC
jgi:hypothetical protein